MDLPTYEDVLAARARIAGRVVRTPMLRNPLLDERTGATVLIKPEPLQRTGSFKFRGATNATLKLTDAQRAAGLVTHSSGNHGQAVACAAAAVGARATVFMPADAPAIKVESTRRWGAEIIAYDRVRDDREALSAGYVVQTGASLVPPFDHPDVIAGQGTLALELAEDAASAGLTLDALLVCTGGGGLIGGCALAMSGASPGTKVVAVEPEGWDDTGRSLKEGPPRQQCPGWLDAVRRAAGADAGRDHLRSQPGASGRCRRGIGCRRAGGDGVRLHPSEARGGAGWRRRAGGVAVRALPGRGPDRRHRHQRRQRRPGGVRPRACRMTRVEGAAADGCKARRVPCDLPI